MELILIRHGQSESNAGISNELDSNLTELGRAQAAATADYILNSLVADASISIELYVSPFKRTLQTCKYLAERTGVRARAHHLLCEYFADSNLEYKSFRGLDSETLRRECPFVDIDLLKQHWSQWWPESLEGPHAIYDRVSRVRDELYAEYAHSAKRVVVYSHAEPIGRLIEAMLRVTPDIEGPPWTDNCGVWRLNVVNPALPAEILAKNDISHLVEHGLESPANL